MHALKAARRAVSMVATVVAAADSLVIQGLHVRVPKTSAGGTAAATSKKEGKKLSIDSLL